MACAICSAASEFEQITLQHGGEMRAFLVTFRVPLRDKNPGGVIISRPRLHQEHIIFAPSVPAALVFIRFLSPPRLSDEARTHLLTSPALAHQNTFSIKLMTTDFLTANGMGRIASRQPEWHGDVNRPTEASEMPSAAKPLSPLCRAAACQLCPREDRGDASVKMA